jgi:serine/threonine protein kinase
MKTVELTMAVESAATFIAKHSKRTASAVLASQAAFDNAYRAIALKRHPDHNHGKEWSGWPDLQEAAKVLRSHFTGVPIAPIVAKATVVTSRNGSYTISTTPIGRSMFSNLYGCETTNGSAVFKIIRDPKDNEFALTEATSLAKLATDPIGCKYVQEIVDSFPVKDGTKRRHAIVLGRVQGAYSLAQIAAAYPNRLDPRDMAWMFNRLLEGLHYAHKARIIHGCLTPDTIFYDVAQHGIAITEWSCSVTVESGAHVKAVSEKRKAFYPPEVLDKRPPTFATDVFMAASCMRYLLGSANHIAVNVPREIRGLLNASLIQSPARRIKTVESLSADFSEVLTKLYGPRKFRPFTMPA